MVSQRTYTQTLSKLRKVCATFPEIEERPSHGAPSFFIRGKKTLCMFVNDHHGDDILGLWCPALPGVQEELIALEPDRFYRPPYVGPSGWIGVRLDVDVDWDEIRDILEESYRKVAPKTLVKLLDAGAG